MWSLKRSFERTLEIEAAAQTLIDDVGVDAEAYCLLAMDAEDLSDAKRRWWSDVLRVVRRQQGK